MTVKLLTQDEIKNLITVQEAVNAVEQSFRLMADGKALHPNKRIFHSYGWNLASIFAISGADTTTNTMILKTLSMNWTNPELRKIPHMYGLIFLCELQSGVPKCIMDATYLTNIRTGAIAGVGAKYLARKESRTLAVIGSREIARFATLAVKFVLPDLFKINVYSRSKTNREKFAKEMMSIIGVDVSSADSVASAVSGADVIITATSSEEPLLSYPMLGTGAFVASLGSTNEVDPLLLKTVKLVPEALEECSERGRTGIAMRKGVISDEDVHGQLCDIVSGKVSGRTSDEQTFLLDSIGLAIEDICVANIVLSKAEKVGIGSELNLFQNPFLEKSSMPGTT